MDDLSVPVDVLADTLAGPWAALKRRLRTEWAGVDLSYDPTLSVPEARRRTTAQLRALPDKPDPASATAYYEVLAQHNLSVMVKAGVQWGLFGGAIKNLGTAEHHDRYLEPLRRLEVLGCFAMTETGHGSDVQSLRTTANYLPDSQEFEITTPVPSARKEYIGGAAADARVAVVFAQLHTPSLDSSAGVHAFVVPIRDDAGVPLPGVTLSDCGVKGGLNGVDNGRIVFQRVRVPRTALLDRYAGVEPDGSYRTVIESPSRRFFTMLGTLVRGRAAVAGSAGAAAQVALSIAARYAERRSQFTDDAGDEVVLMDYLTHQRRLLPAIARSYALQFAQNQLVQRLDALPAADVASPEEQLASRELEARAAGLKALASWHGIHAVQTARECCGGAGYMAENRLTTLRGDIDVFATFEGDNTVLLQTVAKQLLTTYSQEVGDLDFTAMVGFVARSAVDVVIERTAAQTLVQRLVDTAPAFEFDPLDRGAQLALFEDREKHLLETAARRLRSAAGSDSGSGFAAFNAVTDHLIAAAQAHIERVVLEAFLAGIDTCEDEPTRRLLDAVCDLYALCAVEADKAWFLEHGRLSAARSKAITAAINELCRTLRPQTRALVDGFGIPPETLNAAVLDGPAD